ncbi:hypothetical protein [Spirillospora sp. CA-294931]|uniref:hypothetical protein n=1 Tax=Spirillospora sp. CA-294931 TaxID=3240042 RepID=UPI003D8C34F9
MFSPLHLSWWRESWSHGQATQRLDVLARAMARRGWRFETIYTLSPPVLFLYAKDAEAVGVFVTALKQARRWHYCVSDDAHPCNDVEQAAKHIDATLKIRMFPNFRAGGTTDQAAYR